MRAESLGFRNPRASFDSCPQHCGGPRKEGHKKDRQVKPKGLDVLEFGGEVALEIVFDDEDSEEIGVAVGAEDVPRESSKAEGSDCDGMKEAEGVGPALGKERPEKNGSAGENNCGRAFCEGSEAEKETEENEGQPRRSRENRRVFVAHEAQDDRGADHGDRERRAEGHIRGGGV